ncbi:MAG: hypothetical protein IKE21_00065 [Erysipelotrichaceae bacterium]|nr:hypothetical protein [Erysipelotrichaceae bacterium]
MKNYREQILNRLLDKYESSKSFIGANSVNQSFKIELSKVFPEYADDSHVKEIQQVNEAVNELEKDRFVSSVYRRNGLLYAVKLNTDRLDDCYAKLKRRPKKDTNEQLLAILDKYCKGSDVVNTFARTQIERIRNNKKVEHFKGDINEYESLLKILSEVTRVDKETFIRDFSIRVLGDSKAFEKIKSTVVSVLDQYGDFPDRDAILQDLNIIKNPGHVFLKGNGIIQIKGQTIDLNVLQGDIAVSSSLLPDIEKITVTGKSVVTIENLTTFNSYRPRDEFVIYLGGYHNALRREFIKLLYKQNPEAEYYHYGDIDAGGFYILLHLRAKTGVQFKPLHMDVTTLSNNMQFSKPLTENDIKRLKSFEQSEFKEVVAYMLKNNCKLEQEALD